MEEQNTTEGSTPNMEEEIEGGGGRKRVAIKIIIVLVAIIILGAIYMFARKSTDDGKIGEGDNVKQEEPAPITEETPAVTPEQEETTATTTPAEETSEDAQGVFFKDSGYEPKTLTIKKGETVIFINTTQTPTWPASADHPAHTVYPGSDIAKCGTLEQATIFDACRGLQTGESWSFKFNNIGAWNYHDHLNPSQSGTIVVE